MIITYAGGHCFKLSSGSTTMAINPPSQQSPLKIPKFSADVVLIAGAHPDWDGEETASHGAHEPFVIRGPGAYEVGDIVVNGYSSEGSFGGEVSDNKNTVYSVLFDGLHILILGGLTSQKLSPAARADIDNVDILFVPVGEYTLDAKSAHSITTSLEPRLTIPFKVGKGGNDIQEFLKAAGAADVKPVEKITLRTKEVQEMEGEIALLK